MGLSGTPLRIEKGTGGEGTWTDTGHVGDTRWAASLGAHSTAEEHEPEELCPGSAACSRWMRPFGICLGFSLQRLHL